MTDQAAVVQSPREELIGALSRVMRQDFAVSPKHEPAWSGPIWVCSSCGKVLAGRTWKADHKRHEPKHRLTELTPEEVALARERIKTFVELCKYVRRVTAEIFQGKTSGVFIDLSKASVAFVDDTVYDADAPEVTAPVGADDEATLRNLLGALETYVLDRATAGIVALTRARDPAKVHAQLQALLNSSRSSNG